MIVAMLQMFGLVRSEPTKGKQGEGPGAEITANAPETGITSGNSEKAGPRAEVAARSDRRPAVKAPAKKTAASPAANKPAAKKAAPASAKPAPKTATAKAPAKAAKPAAKPASQAAAKPAAKAAPAKPVAKPAAKSPAKPAAKAAPAKAPAAKPVPKAAAAKPAAPVKPAAKPVPVPAKAAPAKAAAPEKGKPVPIPLTAIPKPVGAPSASPSSSRGAALAAPSLSSSVTVASNAAKASYSMSPVSAPMPSPAVPQPVKKDPKLANNWKTKSVDQLSDQEVLAMPDTEYMNDKQMAFFRLKLVGLKQDILANAGETTEHLREETVVVPDPADRATIEEEHALELRTRDRERKLLKKIEQSIARIDAGDYGYCDETGEPIGVGRLLARPTATLSLEAQQRRELKQKMFGD